MLDACLADGSCHPRVAMEQATTAVELPVPFT